MGLDFEGHSMSGSRGGPAGVEGHALATAVQEVLLAKGPCSQLPRLSLL